MSNKKRVGKKYGFRCQNGTCEKQAVAMRRVTWDVQNVKGGIALPKGSPIFACGDHIAELEKDLELGFMYYERAKQQKEHPEESSEEL